MAPKDLYQLSDSQVGPRHPRFSLWPRGQRGSSGLGGRGLESAHASQRAPCCLPLKAPGEVGLVPHTQRTKLGFRALERGTVAAPSWAGGGPGSGKAMSAAVGMWAVVYHLSVSYGRAHPLPVWSINDRGCSLAEAHASEV